jgi:hypothetical protein
MRKTIIAAAAAVLAASAAATPAHADGDHGARNYPGHAGRGHATARHLVEHAPFIAPPPARLVGPATYTFSPGRANPFGPSFFLYQGPACNYVWPYTAWPDKTCIPSNGFHWERW